MEIEIVTYDVVFGWVIWIKIIFKRCMAVAYCNGNARSHDSKFERSTSPESKVCPFLRILCLSCPCISEVPATDSMLPYLQTPELKVCNKIQDLLTLFASLNNLLVLSITLQVVLVLSNLTSSVQFDLSNGSSWREGSKIRQLVGWIGRLSRLNELSLNLLNVPAPTE